LAGGRISWDNRCIAIVWDIILIAVFIPIALCLVLLVLLQWADILPPGFGDWLERRLRWIWGVALLAQKTWTERKQRM
jgi:hypothetical protein